MGMGNGLEAPLIGIGPLMSALVNAPDFDVAVLIGGNGNGFFSYSLFLFFSVEVEDEEFFDDENVILKKLPNVLLLVSLSPCKFGVETDFFDAFFAFLFFDFLSCFFFSCDKIFFDRWKSSS